MGSILTKDGGIVKVGNSALTTLELSGITIPEASNTNPVMDGTAAVGVSSMYARGDHVHPSDTSKQNKILADGVLQGDGSGTVTAATIDSTPTSASTNLVSSGGVFSAIKNKVNRTTAVNTADTGYTTLMARGEKLLDSTTYDGVSDWSTQLVNGAIAWRYE